MILFMVSEIVSLLLCNFHVIAGKDRWYSLRPKMNDHWDSKNLGDTIACQCRL